MEKICSKCGETKPLKGYNRDKSASDGHRRDCRECQKARWQEKKAQRKRARKDPKEHDYGQAKLPEGYSIRGISQYVNAEGKIVSQWIKSARDPRDAMAQAYLEALQELCEPLKGSMGTIPPPTMHLEADLLNVIPIGDSHIGLHCWGEEVGENFDLKIAEANLKAAVDSLLATAPAARECLLINVGDYFHMDSSKNQTAKGTQVDVDGRFAKVMRVGLEIFRYMIRAALKKHEIVNVITVGGNHDVQTGAMLATALALMFDEEPRVNINPSPAKHQYHRFGRCFFGVTHGDGCKVGDLPIVMATDRPQDWAESEYRHWYTGHIHHDVIKDLAGATVESVRVLAPADAWHKGAGYRSMRDLKCYTWHREYGPDQRNVIGIRRIKDLVKCTD